MTPRLRALSAVVCALAASASLTTTAHADSQGADKWAVTVTRTFAPPPGTHVAPYGYGAKVTDDAGRTLGTVVPGEVEDTSGNIHLITWSVTGNTVVQTIQGAPPGGSIEGTMSPGTTSLADPASLLPRAANDDDPKAKWRKCMNQQVIEGALLGGVATIETGGEGAALGAFGGLMLGFGKCGLHP
ncbi:hypothetical protein [Streptomyces silvisoli]|uniref:Uncharacterized protein n=1 Tax=Streptomyces silvisoli TaxID=3034235 RepID=A0ABT5ZP89_9ACTN|nr:hypothetical protein [Streptomyces silvisoli]MDF3291628.1 hypothetical protein [Streptomyces silvisoli]